VLLVAVCLAYGATGEVSEPMRIKVERRATAYLYTYSEFSILDSDRRI